jgi:hypothetical protein
MRTPASARYSPQPSRAEDQINAHEFVNPRESGDSQHVKQRCSDARSGDSLFHSCCRKVTALSLLESVILNLESRQSSSVRRHRKLGRYFSTLSVNRTSTSRSSGAQMGEFHWPMSSRFLDFAVWIGLRIPISFCSFWFSSLASLLASLLVSPLRCETESNPPRCRAALQLSPFFPL